MYVGANQCHHDGFDSDFDKYSANDEDEIEDIKPKCNAVIKQIW